MVVPIARQAPGTAIVDDVRPWADEYAARSTGSSDYNTLFGWPGRQLAEPALQRFGGGPFHDILLILRDQRGSQLRVARPVADAKFTDIDVGLPQSRSLLVNQMEAIVGADEMVIRGAETEYRADGNPHGEREDSGHLWHSFAFAGWATAVQNRVRASSQAASKYSFSTACGNSSPPLSNAVAAQVPLGLIPTSAVQYVGGDGWIIRAGCAQTGGRPAACIQADSTHGGTRSLAPTAESSRFR